MGLDSNVWRARYEVARAMELGEAREDVLSIMRSAAMCELGFSETDWLRHLHDNAWLHRDRSCKYHRAFATTKGFSLCKLHASASHRVKKDGRWAWSEYGDVIGYEPPRKKSEETKMVTIKVLLEEHEIDQIMKVLDYSLNDSPEDAVREVLSHWLANCRPKELRGKRVA